MERKEIHSFRFLPIRLSRLYDNQACGTRASARIIQACSTDKDSIILDSFAGSGTTAHAVLALNKEDGGNRKFILAECEDYADKITAERVRRVIKNSRNLLLPKSQGTELLRETLTWSKLTKAADLVAKVRDIETIQRTDFDKITKQVKDSALIVTGEKKVKEQAEGLSGSFTYCTLGDEISPEKMLTGENLPDYETLARHLVYTATGQAPDKTSQGTKDKDGFFYEASDRLFYLIYEPDLAFLRSADSALNSDRAERIAKQTKKKQKTAVVFATHKFMGQKELTDMGMVFCGLPYERLWGGIASFANASLASHIGVKRDTEMMDKLITQEIGETYCHGREAGGGCLCFRFFDLGPERIQELAVNHCTWRTAN